MRSPSASLMFDQLPRGVKTLIVANGACFLLQLVVPAPLIDALALTPNFLWTRFFLWQLITYSFLHAGFWHLFINMFSLWMFGAQIENYWGTKTFLKYYFLCVAGAALTQAFVAPNVMVMGASGGVYGLLLAFGYLFPDVTLFLFFIFPMRAIQAVFVIGFMTFLFSIDAQGSNVAHMAHLGGMATGLLYFKIPVWLSRYKRPRFHILNADFESEPEKLSREVDRILEKISAKGVDSLTPEEHATMKKYSEKI